MENREWIRVLSRGGVDLEPAFLNTGRDTTAIGQGPLLVGELSAVPVVFSSGVPGKLLNKTSLGVVDSDLLHYVLLEYISIYRMCLSNWPGQLCHHPKRPPKWVCFDPHQMGHRHGGWTLADSPGLQTLIWTGWWTEPVYRFHCKTKSFCPWPGPRQCSNPCQCWFLIHQETLLPLKETWFLRIIGFGKRIRLGIFRYLFLLWMRDATRTWDIQGFI